MFMVKNNASGGVKNSKKPPMRYGGTSGRKAKNMNFNTPITI